jgi:hypothetical protein
MIALIERIRRVLEGARGLFGLLITETRGPRRVLAHARWMEIGQRWGGLAGCSGVWRARRGARGAGVACHGDRGLVAVRLVTFASDLPRPASPRS